MEENQEGMAFLRAYRAHPSHYAPLVDHQYRHFETWDADGVKNVCWCAGCVEDSRPFFAECWQYGTATMLTVFISSDGLPMWGDRYSVMAWLRQHGLIRSYDPAHTYTRVEPYTDDSGHAFYSVNLVLGDEDHGQYVFWNTPSHSYRELDRLNEGRSAT
ncbi:MAG: hypothetical protein IJ246_03605 [Clostridia bacterium]|nr:hypothetical protein [Clostridia bacterium]